MHECAITRALPATGGQGAAALEETPFKAYLRKTEEQAARDFEKHVIKSKGEGRWVISQQYEDDGSWSNHLLTEIIVGVYGTLITHGDTSPVIFCSYGKYEEPLQVVHWVARSGISGYLQSKAQIGFLAPYDRDLSKAFVDDVAIWELKDRLIDRLAELEEEPDGDESDDPEVAAWRKAIRGVGGDPWEMVRWQLYEDLEDAGCGDVGEMIWEIGEVPSSRLFYSQAACRKLLELLEAEGNNE